MRKDLPTTAAEWTPPANYDGTHGSGNHLL